MVISKKALITLLVVLLRNSPTFAIPPAPPLRTQTLSEIGQETRPLQVVPGLQFNNLDCSHLVHAIYESVGLHYQYTTSRILYRGTEQFRRVMSPKAGDLIAWRGHVGIVVDPSRHLFFSALHTGLKMSSYVSGYWKERGRARFLRYSATSGTPDASARVEVTASLALAAANSQ
jgi:NlpC/P60 family